MKVISVFNKKGGVAKTISTINIGAVLVEKGYKVLIIDIDPQGNSSVLMNNREIRDKDGKVVRINGEIQTEDCYDLKKLTINDLLLHNVDINKLIKKTAYEGFDIITANADLEFTEKEILNDKKNNQITRIEKALKSIKDKYDYCIIDCPPNLNIITVNALMASDDLVVPFMIDQMSVDGIGGILERINEIKDDLHAKINIRGCFVTRDKATTVNKAMKEVLKEQLGGLLLRTSIKENVKVTESTFYQKPVVFYSPKSNASKCYRELVSELFNK